MDPTKEKTDLEKLLESMNTTDTITLNNPGAVSGSCGYESGYGPTPPYSDDTITISSGSSNWDSNTYSYNNNITSGGFAYPNTASVTGGPYTISSVGANTGISLNPWATNTNSTKIQLDGEGADIKINGWSLIDAIQKIEERLNILHPNTELEAEWEELRALGEQYRKLEQHIKDKQATWDKLKAMPPPVVE
jgi:hypothetical protein